MKAALLAAPEADDDPVERRQGLELSAGPIAEDLGGLGEDVAPVRDVAGADERARVEDGGDNHAGAVQHLGDPDRSVEFGFRRALLDFAASPAWQPAPSGRIP